MPEEDGGLYDIAEFINYGIRMTTAFLDYQKDLLQCDFDMLLMKDKLFAEYDTLQYLYLMESKDNMRDTYTGTSFNAHLMPVREVYDINSVQDWRTQKHTAGWTPENVLCIFPRKNLPNGAKLPAKNVNCVKKVFLLPLIFLKNLSRQFLFLFIWKQLIKRLCFPLIYKIACRC